MYVPPPASTVSFRFGSSCAAQRGCWKLFHDTPTVQSTAAPPSALGADDAPVLEHAAKTTATTPTSAANLRFAMLLIPPRLDLVSLSAPRVPR
jgi:hypothetical protein